MESIYGRLPRVFNVASTLIEANLREGRAEAPAYLYKNGGRLSYEQLRDSVAKMASLLRELGIEWENRVAILLPDGPELALAFWGAVWMGAVPVPINTSYRLDDITYILQDCRAKVVVTTRKWREQLPDRISPWLRNLLIVDDTTSLLDRLAAERRVPEPAAETCKDDAAFWLYTSGSTGRPKGVVHLHHDMVVSAELYARNFLRLGEADILYSVAKVPFAYGLGNSLYFPLALGATAVLSDAGNAFEFISDIHDFRPTVLFGIPSSYSAMLSVQDISPLDPSSLRMCISAAESLPPSIWYRWRERYGRDIYEGIGTTELLHIFLANRPGQCKPGSTGQVVPGYEVRVVDEQGVPVGAGEVGDLEVGGESLMSGYWNRHDETRRAIFGEVMRTGDKYLVDDQGYFYFAGRGDDRFKINGQWVVPIEVEDILLQYPGVLDAAIVAETIDQEALPRLVGYVVLAPDQSPTADAERGLRAHSRQRLPHFKVPQRFVFVPSIERTATGKIDRKHLREEHGREGGQKG